MENQESTESAAWKEQKLINRQNREQMGRIEKFMEEMASNLKELVKVATRQQALEERLIRDELDNEKKFDVLFGLSRQQEETFRQHEKACSMFRSEFDSKLFKHALAEKQEEYKSLLVKIRERKKTAISVGLVVFAFVLNQAWELIVKLYGVLQAAQ